MTPTASHQEFQWKCQPAAENLLMRMLKEYANQNVQIAQLEKELHTQTSTRLFDWIDHLAVIASPQIEVELEETGFIQEISGTSYRVFYHPGAQLPRVMVCDQGQAVNGIAVKVESIADYLMVRGLSTWIEGSVLSGFRRAVATLENGVHLWVVERRGTRGMEPTHCEASYLEKLLLAKEKWQSRRRQSMDEVQEMQSTIALAEELASLVGRDMAAWIVLEGYL